MITGWSLHVPPVDRFSSDRSFLFVPNFCRHGICIGYSPLRFLLHSSIKSTLGSYFILQTLIGTGRAPILRDRSDNKERKPVGDTFWATVEGVNDRSRHLSQAELTHVRGGVIRLQGTSRSHGSISSGPSFEGRSCCHRCLQRTLHKKGFSGTQRGAQREERRERKTKSGWRWVGIRITKEQRRIKKGKRGHLIFSLFHNYFIITS